VAHQRKTRAKSGLAAETTKPYDPLRFMEGRIVTLRRDVPLFENIFAKTATGAREAEQAGRPFK